MKNIRFISFSGAFILPSLVVFMLLSLVACNKDRYAIDDVPPSIDVGFMGAFPKQCSTLKRGETFTFRARFTDNVELGSFSLDIHHNFDHHSHSTEAGECTLEPVKVPINPFVLIKSYDIPAGKQSYEAEITITIPADVDPGNYHFMIMVSDQTGWTDMKGLSVHITE